MNRIKNKKAQKKISKKLCQTIKEGTFLYMDGELAPPSKISNMMLQERGNYMADYVTDDLGCIREIHYNKIKEI